MWWLGAMIIRNGAAVCPWICWTSIITARPTGLLMLSTNTTATTAKDLRCMWVNMPWPMATARWAIWMLHWARPSIWWVWRTMPTWWNWHLMPPSSSTRMMPVGARIWYASAAVVRWALRATTCNSSCHSIWARRCWKCSKLILIKIRWWNRLRQSRVEWGMVHGTHAPLSNVIKRWTACMATGR